MRFVVRFLTVAVLGWGMLVLFKLAKEAQANGADSSSTFICCFAGVILLGAIAAGVLAFSLLPLVGDVVGGWLFSSNQQIERHPHAAALAKIAAGDYEGAIDEFRAVLEENPMDMLAAREIVHIYCDKLHDRDSAVEFLQDAIATGHWSDIQRGLLNERLKEINTGG